MNLKRKIAIVAGDLKVPRLLGLFEGLRESWDPTIFVLNNTHTINNHGTSLKMQVFENISEMPGYMRDLEDQIDGYEFVLCFETSRLATFQAVRVARKLGVPCGVVVNEYQPYFYEEFQNIRAVQYDVIQKSDVFFATSSQAANTLLVDGVPKEKIRRVNPPVDQHRFSYQPALRQKFRHYIGIKDGELVVLVKSALENWSCITTLFQAVSLLKKRGTLGARNVRILIAGDGSRSRDLKYKAFDLGIGNQTMFLHQDPEPFLRDMYCASDLLFEPRMTRGDFLPDIPLHVPESMACGVVPVVLSGSLAAEFAGDAGFSYGEDSPEALAAVLQNLLMNPVSFETKRLSVQRRVSERFELGTQSNLVASVVDEVFTQRNATGERPESRVKNLLEEARQQIESGRDRDALVTLEECNIIGLKTNSERVMWHLLRGDAYYGLGDMEQATKDYSDCMRLDDRNVDCLRGLGFVSWKGHSNEEAMIFFRKAVALKQDDRRSQYGIGMVYRRLGLLEESLFWLEKSLIGPDRPDSAMIAFSQTCIQLNRPDKAVRRLEQAMDTVGEHPTLMMALGQLYMTLGKIPEAQDLMQRAGRMAG